MQECFIETHSALVELCQQLENSPWLALDTEFMREKTYYPKLCLIQICNGKMSACIDPLVIDDLSPLKDLIYDSPATKIFHAASQDLEIFLMTWKSLPSPLFDSQLAATLLGLGDQIGYGNLVQKYLGISLEKTQSRTDWSARPLDLDQLRYAHDDVIYLGQVYEKMQQDLEQQKRRHWLNEDFEKLTKTETYLPQYHKIWTKVKGKQHLKGIQIVILNSLATWREEFAIASNRPKRWILKDEVLIDLAKRQPKNLTQLQKIRGMEGKFLKNHAETLLGLIDKAINLPKEDWPKIEKIPTKATPDQEALIDLLMCGLRVIANQHNIMSSMIASRKEIEKLAKGNDNIELLSGWRKSLAGDDLVKLLNNQLQLNIHQGKVRLQ